MCTTWLGVMRFLGFGVVRTVLCMVHWILCMGVCVCETFNEASDKYMDGVCVCVFGWVGAWVFLGK